MKNEYSVILVENLTHTMIVSAANEDEAEKVAKEEFENGVLPLKTERTDFYSEDVEKMNGCAECERSYGPHYTGNCEH